MLVVSIITEPSLLAAIFLQLLTVCNELTNFFVSHELQFGFRKGLGSPNAVFTVQYNRLLIISLNVAVLRSWLLLML